MTEKIKLSTAMRDGSVGIEPDFWWFIMPEGPVREGDSVLEATHACDLGCAWLGAIKAGVETAPRYYDSNPGENFMEWMEEYWPELLTTVINPDRGIPDTLEMTILWLNDEWTREEVIAWLENMGY